MNIRGDAWTLKPNIETRNAQIGDVLLEKFGKVYHASLIVGIRNSTEVDAEIMVKEWNYTPCQPGTRVLRLSDKSVIGVLHPQDTPKL